MGRRLEGGGEGIKQRRLAVTNSHGDGKRSVGHTVSDTVMTLDGTRSAPDLSGKSLRTIMYVSNPCHSPETNISNIVNCNWKIKIKQFFSFNMTDVLMS